jgi:UMF1 family MFS transporter
MRWRERLALHRPELLCWALYDVANSAAYTVIVTGVFPVFFARTAAAAGLSELEAEERFGLATTIGLAVVALLAPVLGALADAGGKKKRFLAGFMLLGAAACAGMFLIGPGEWRLAALLFALANIGAAGSLVFYDALLPHVAHPAELDRASSTGYALGYLGGGLLLALNLWWIVSPATFGLPSGEDLSPSDASLPARLAFLSVGVWWLAFSLPLLLRVHEPPRVLEADERPDQKTLRVAFTRLVETFTELRRHGQAFRLLVAFLIYNDGIGTIIRMAVIYGDRIGIEQQDLLVAVVLVQFVGVPCAFAFGQLAGRLGAKRAILVGLAIYVLISFLGYTMTTRTHFFVLAALVGLVQGGTQALSRSLFASMVPRHKSAEFFGLFGVLEKFAGLLGPYLFVLANRHSESGRAGMAVVLLFFAVGAALLLRVDVEAGRRAARSAEAQTRPLAG